MGGVFKFYIYPPSLNMKNSALIRIFSFKRFLRLLMGLLLFSNCMLSSDLLDPDETYLALVCYGRGFSDIRFECGSGTAIDPFVIANLAQLMALQNGEDLWASGKHFDVARNLDLGSIAEDWRPIGKDPSPKFNGTFRGLRPNGQPVQIFNLQINQSANDNLGFFGYTNGAIIENVGMENVNITGNQRLGGLVGWSNDAGVTIINCYAAGVIKGVQDIGGLLGRGEGAGITKIDNSYSTVDVTGTGNSIGGLVGSNNASSEIGNSYSTGDVMGNDELGGLVGLNESNSAIESSYATGNVTGNDELGGLVGKSDSSDIENSYATGNVTGNDKLGGLVGLNDNSSAIENSYATGTVMGAVNQIGGFVGDNDGASVIRNSYATGAVASTGIGIPPTVGGLVGRSGPINETNYFVASVGGTDGVGLGLTCTTCLQRTLEQLRGLNEASASAFTPPWPSSSWTRLNEPGFPCIATITFGRGGCPP